MKIKDGDIFRGGENLFVAHITDECLVKAGSSGGGYAYTWAPLTSGYGALGNTTNEKRNITQFIADGYEYVGNIQEFGDAFIEHLLKRDL